MHSRPLPRLGGVAIFLSFACCTAFAAFWIGHHPELHRRFSIKIAATILGPAALVFLLGVFDDLRGVGPYVKFSVQGVAATMLFLGGLRIVNIPVLFGDRSLPWFLGLPLTIVWVLAITNAFNLIDGLDGLAAGSALFSTLVMFVVALLNGPSLVTVLTIALAGAILGFLRYNFNPATIFLGDSGSLFIGFILSALALYGAQKAPTIVAIAIPIVSFGLPILETTLSILRRLISGRPVFTADREHIHHKLLQHGMTAILVLVIVAWFHYCIAGHVYRQLQPFQICCKYKMLTAPLPPTPGTVGASETPGTRQPPAPPPGLKPANAPAKVFGASLGKATAPPEPPKGLPPPPPP